MPRPTQFSIDWLNLCDSNNNLIAEWCSKGREACECFCKLCLCYFSCANKGKEQLFQHSRTVKHRKAAEVHFSTKQTKLFVSESTKTVGLSSATSKEWCLTEDDRKHKAEILWAFKLAQSNYSYASCDELPTLFTMMFGDAAKGITLDRTKISYLISHGLGPYISAELVSVLRKSAAYYALEVDETTTTQIKKQLDLHVRFWDETLKECNVSSRYLTSIFLGHARAEQLTNSICQTLEKYGLELSKMIMIAMDGPNVNKSMWKKVNEVVKVSGSPGLLDVGSCNLHIIHNAFGTGLKSVEETKVDDFAYDVHKWFHVSPARREDMKNIQEILSLSQELFLSHVSCRWLSLIPSLKRLVEQLPGLKHYFLSTLPKSDKRKCETDRYRRIAKCLRDKQLPAQLHFIISTGDLFSRFLTLFQKECPLVHILYSELEDLVSKLLNRFVKADCLKDLHGSALLNIDVSDSKNVLPDSKIEVGSDARKALLSSELSDKDRLQFYSNVRKFFVSSYLKLSATLPLKNPILKDLQCIDPKNRQCSKYTDYLRRLLTKIRHPLLEGDEEKVIDDWKCYQIDPEIEEEWYIQKMENGNVKYKRADDYWNKIMSLKTASGACKYPHLTKIVKCALILAHGNADVERGFSVNKSIVTSERASLKENSIIGLRTVKDYVQKKGGVTNVDITKEMIQAAKNSHGLYRKERDEKKNLTEKEKKKAANVSSKSFCKKSLLQELQNAEKLMEEGTSRLAGALKRKDIPDASVATELIDTAQKKMRKLHTQLEYLNQASDKK